MKRKTYPTDLSDEQWKLLSLMSDNGSQPTSRSFMETCSGLEIKQAFNAYNNPKGNADTERMMRIKKNCAGCGNGNRRMN